VKKIILLLLIPVMSKAQFVLQGVATQSSNMITINGISQTPYAGRAFCTTAFNLNNNFDLRFNAYMGNVFNNGMAFLFITTPPTISNPPTVINTDNIHNFGTGSIANDFVVEFDIRGSFCYAGQNTSYEPTTDVNHVSYWKNNSSCNFGNYFSAYSSLGTINYYAFEPYEIKWTKSTNTLATYYNNILIKSNIIDLVGLLGTTVYWGFSSGCYCVTGGPALKDVYLNGAWLLPFDITSFNATKYDNAIKLNWETDREQNTSYFIVEKSNDGVNFSFLQKVDAAVNSTTIKKYSMIDDKPLYGTNFYRLKMVDASGRLTHSDIVAVKFNSSSKEMTVFPNPAQKELQVQIPASISGQAVLQIQDISGRVLKEETIQLNNSLFSTSINTNDLSKGIYLLVLRHGNKKETKKFIKN